MENTINIYKGLRDEASSHNFEGIFYAFSNEQFNEGLKRIEGLREGDEKIISCGGGLYGLKKYIDKMFNYYDEVNKKIAEQCNPQDVYDYEYANYECCIAYEGDTNAIELVLDLFGEERTRKVKRKRVRITIDQLLLKPFVVEGLTFDNGKTPSSLWFDDEGKCFTMFACALYPVKKDGVQYKTYNKTLFGLSARYNLNLNKVYGFYKD